MEVLRKNAERGVNSPTQDDISSLYKTRIEPPDEFLNISTDQEDAKGRALYRRGKLKARRNKS